MFIRSKATMPDMSVLWSLIHCVRYYISLPTLYWCLSLLEPLIEWQSLSGLRFFVAGFEESLHSLCVEASRFVPGAPNSTTTCDSTAASATGAELPSHFDWKVPILPCNFLPTSPQSDLCTSLSSLLCHYNDDHVACIRRLYIAYITKALRASAISLGPRLLRGAI